VAQWSAQIYGHIAGTGFLLISGKQQGPVSYDIAVIRKGGTLCGRGRIEGPNALLRRARVIRRLELVLADGTHVEATVMTITAGSARIELR
jgi:hypothetical protein